MKPRLLFSRNSQQSYRRFFEEAGFSTIVIPYLYSPDVTEGAVGAVFCGGADVNPALYGEDLIGSAGTHFDRNADVEDADLFELATQRGIPSIGICRGLQFVNVMHGGTLCQHLDNHAGSNHFVTTKWGAKQLVNSYHHQMVIPPVDAVVLASCSSHISNKYYSNVHPEEEVEAVFYPNSNSIGVQWHPEINSSSDGESLFWKIFEMTGIKMPAEQAA
jgi:gamma-glutamyl-gamma-aminobutyrate hydrolase PuuD